MVFKGRMVSSCDLLRSERAGGPPIAPTAAAGGPEDRNSDRGGIGRPPDVLFDLGMGGTSLL